MKKMKIKKMNVAQCIVLCLLSSVLLVSTSSAKYLTSGNANLDLSVAEPVIKMVYTDDAVRVNGDYTEFTFQIVNNKTEGGSEKINDVTLLYQLNIRTAMAYQIFEGAGIQDLTTMVYMKNGVSEDYLMNHSVEQTDTFVLVMKTADLGSTDITGLISLTAQQVFSADVTQYKAMKVYYKELKNIEQQVYELIQAGNPDNFEGALIPITDPVQILGLAYTGGNGWYYISKSAAEDLIGFPVDPARSSGFIVKYVDSEYGTGAGAVMSIDGMLVKNQLIYSLNYSGDVDSFYLPGLLTGLDGNSTKPAFTSPPQKWGEMNITGGTGNPGEPIEFDEDGGLVLSGNNNTGNALTLALDQSKPINERFSINVTVKGSIYQDKETYGATIVAISDANAKYLCWVRIRNGVLQVLTYTTSNASGFTTGSATDHMGKALPTDLDNNYMNIQVTAVRSGTTNVYLNGDLFMTFPSGTAVLSYGTCTIGDLRLNNSGSTPRNLKYAGAIYNFAIYSEVLDPAAVQWNWNYTKYQLLKNLDVSVSAVDSSGTLMIDPYIGTDIYYWKKKSDGVPGVSIVTTTTDLSNDGWALYTDGMELTDVAPGDYIMAVRVTNAAVGKVSAVGAALYSP